MVCVFYHVFMVNFYDIYVYIIKLPGRGIGIPEPAHQKLFFQGMETSHHWLIEKDV